MFELAGTNPFPPIFLSRSLVVRSMVKPNNDMFGLEVGTSEACTTLHNKTEIKPMNNPGLKLVLPYSFIIILDTVDFCNCKILLF